jgi:hypothetical protein
MDGHPRELRIDGLAPLDRRAEPMRRRRGPQRLPTCAAPQQLIGTRAGLAAAAASGRKGGRPRKIDDADAIKARNLREKGISPIDIAKMLGVSRATVYRYFAFAELAS